MSAIKYQVFISSTYEDLKDERRAVMEAIMNAGHIPIGMEAFQASDDDQWTYITRRIDESDYYVVIIAERYGSMKDGKSYTQMEYEYAIASGVPAIGMLLHDDARTLWPASRVESGRSKKIKDFRGVVGQKVVKFWRNADDLALKVSQALNEQVRVNPRIGWVRADKVPSEKVLNELATLSEEKRRLQEQLDAMGGVEPPLVIPPEYRWHIERMEELTVEDVLFAEHGDDPKSLLTMFLELQDPLAENQFEDDILEFIRDVLDYRLEKDEISLLMKEYVKAALVNISTSQNKQQRYGLTDRGKQMLIYAAVWRQRRKTQTHPV